MIVYPCHDRCPPVILDKEYNFADNADVFFSHISEYLEWLYMHDKNSHDS